MNTPTKLPILFSCRIRLDDNQRKALKDAYYKKANHTNNQSSPTTGLVITSNTTSAVCVELGMSHLVVVDLLSSRDSINITIVNKLQEVLGVEVVSREKLAEAFNSYLDYVLS